MDAGPGTGIKVYESDMIFLIFERSGLLERGLAGSRSAGCHPAIQHGATVRYVQNFKEQILRRAHVAEDMVGRREKSF
jgi:hypothetical protein